MQRGLAHLQARGIPLRDQPLSRVRYTFKHALTQEVAYGSLLQERRRALHARIVEASETLYRDRLTEQIERLAHHALRGESMGQSPGLLPAGWGEGHGTVGQP